MIRRPPRSTQSRSSAASDVYKRQVSVPAGDYSLVVTATTTAGTEQSTQTVQLVAPVLDAVSLSPQAIYTGGDKTTLSYTLTGPATVSVVVRNGAGTTVR